MSFGFVVKRDEWEDTNGEKIRTLVEIENLFDVSPVTFPAYQATSVDVALRSMDAWMELRHKHTAESDADAQHSADQSNGRMPMQSTEQTDGVNKAKIRMKLRQLKIKERTNDCISRVVRQKK
jgi:hypothetical protein